MHKPPLHSLTPPLLHRTADPQRLRLALFIEEHRDFFSEIALAVGVEFDDDLAGLACLDGRFGPFGGGAAAGSAHGLQHDGFFEHILEGKYIAGCAAGP